MWDAPLFSSSSLASGPFVAAAAYSCLWCVASSVGRSARMNECSWCQARPITTWRAATCTVWVTALWLWSILCSMTTQKKRIKSRNIIEVWQKASSYSRSFGFQKTSKGPHFPSRFFILGGVWLLGFCSFCLKVPELSQTIEYFSSSGTCRTDNCLICFRFVPKAC